MVFINDVIKKLSPLLDPFMPNSRINISEKLNSAFCLFYLFLYPPVIIFRSCWDWSSWLEQIKCLAQGHNAVPPAMA